MSYLIHLDEAQRAYLDGLPLSAEAKSRIDDYLEQVLANIPDAIRLDPASRPYAGQPYFKAEFLFLDSAGDGRIHLLECILGDASAPFGVLLMVYLEHHVGRKP